MSMPCIIPLVPSVTAPRCLRRGGTPATASERNFGRGGTRITPLVRRLSCSRLSGAVRAPRLAVGIMRAHGFFRIRVVRPERFSPPRPVDTP